MNPNNNSIRNLYIKCTKTYNKNIKNNYPIINEINDDNISKKNRINLDLKYSREKIRPIQKAKLKEKYNKNTASIYDNKNQQKKMINENMNFLIKNIPTDNNVMTNAVNIHNINLINSMNNITFYDSYHENEIPNIKKDIIKCPINNYSSQTFNNNKNIDLKNNYSMELNNNKENNNNIFVNKKRILYKNKKYINNIDHNTLNNKNSLSQKKNPFKELNYKKLNLSVNNNNSIKFNKKSNNYFNLYKQENKNQINYVYKNFENKSTRDTNQIDLIQFKNRNNNINSTILKDNTKNKTDYSVFNNYSNYTNSLSEEESNGNKNIIVEKNNIRKNIINVKKLDSFKINNSKVNFPSKRIDTSNKSLLDKEDATKEKLYKTKSRDCFNKNEKERNININSQKSQKTKSEEKVHKIKNDDNNTPENIDVTKKIRIFSSFLNENFKKTNNLNSNKNYLGQIYMNETYDYENNNNKFNNSTFNSDNNSKILIINRKQKGYPNKINYKEIQNLIKMTTNTKANNNKKENIIYEKIEVNKKCFNKNSLSKNQNTSKINENKAINTKSSTNLEYMIDTRNECINLYSKKSKKQTWINNTEQVNSTKKMDYFCYLSNYKEKKEEKLIERDKKSGKKSVPKKNIIYNKKQLLCHVKKGRKSIDNRLLSPIYKQRKLDIKECDIKANDKNYMTEDIGKEIIKNDNLQQEISFNDKENYLEEGNCEKEKEIDANKQTNNTYLIKSPQSSIYKKPGITFINNSNSLITNDKETSNNKILVQSNIIAQNENDNHLQSPKRKNRKKYLNIKLNKFIDQKELSSKDNHMKIFKKSNININNINYDKEELLPNIKENNLIQTINSYKPIKMNLSNTPNLLIKENNNKTKVNTSQFSFTVKNKKVQNTNSFIQKFCNYFIAFSQGKSNSFISKIRLNRSNLIINKIPIKQIYYFSKIRKSFVKIIPKIEICYFKKEIITQIIKDETKNSFYCKKENEDFNNSIENINNYFEISFGKKKNKSLINFNNENINTDEQIGFISQNKSIIELKTKNKQNKEKYLNNNIDISPQGKKKFLNNKIITNQNNYNDNYLMKAEKGLKILQTIVDNRKSPFSDKIKNIFLNNNNNLKKDNIRKNIKKEKIKKLNLEIDNLNNCFKKINIDNNKDSKNNISYNTIKNDFIELLNKITVNNYDIILNKISELIINTNIDNIDNISQLLLNQKEFAEVIINKAIKEKQYIKIYAKLCKDLFISLMSFIDNYNDDMDIFDKITKDKNLKIIIKNKIIEIIQQFNSFSESKSGKNNKIESEKDPLYLDIKLKSNGIFYFVGELLETKILSQKSGFEILDMLYKRYINGNSNKYIYNNINLEGIEILLSKMKIIVYEKNKQEHIKRYNKYIKNFSSIFQNIINKNNLPKHLYYKLINIIEKQKNEEEKKRQEKIKTFDGKNNKLSEKDKNEYMKYNNKSLTIIENKYNNNIDNNYISNDDIENYLMNIIKNDIEKLLFNSNIKMKYTLFKEIYQKYKEELNIKKSIHIWDIFYSYIEVCIDIINSEKEINIANEYIENIINNLAIELTNENWEMLHYKLISLFLNINEICSDNIYMYQIMGYLLFALINNKLFFIKDLNNFLKKDNEIIINIAKIVKYTIIFADKNAKKFHNDFKQTKLFIGNQIFYEIVTLPLNKKYYLI